LFLPSSSSVSSFFFLCSPIPQFPRSNPSHIRQIEQQDPNNWYQSLVQRFPPLFFRFLTWRITLAPIRRRVFSDSGVHAPLPTPLAAATA
jgi:hypothetical protein